MEVPVLMSASNETMTALERRRLEMSTEYFLVPTPVMSTGTATSTATPVAHGDLDSLFRNEVWVVPVLSLSALTMLFIAGFEVFVVCKARRTTPSRRHLFLGQMLLLGLFGCAAMGTVLALQPTPLACGVVRFGTGVALALVFASLLVKCVFLISLNSGVYLPASYQALLLLFAVLIQVAIGSQWLATTPPSVESVYVPAVEPVSANSHPRHRLVVTAEDVSRTAMGMGTTKITICHTPYIHLLLSLVYVGFLVTFVTVLAVKSRRIRDNYREATYIGLSIACTIPTSLVWTISGFVVAERHRDACMAFGLCVSSAIIFLIMFMPKGRQLAAMGKDGVYMEDRDERCSSLSRPASGYSPSFFHFKPVKFAPPPAPNATIKHPLNVATLPGDISMYPPPPSYTRLQYHCYPSPPAYYSTRYLSGGVFLRPDDGNVYTTLEPTLSSNPNVYFQRGSGMHPGMMY